MPYSRHTRATAFLQSAVHRLSSKHTVKTLCRVLGVGRSIYHKAYGRKSAPAPRTIENQPAPDLPDIRSCILTIYKSCKKRPGAAKIRTMLIREYGIHISQGRVYKLIKGMTLPKMSTSKPTNKTYEESDTVEKNNILKQGFSQSASSKA